MDRMQNIGVQGFRSYVSGGRGLFKFRVGCSGTGVQGFGVYALQEIGLKFCQVRVLRFVGLGCKVPFVCGGYGTCFLKGLDVSGRGITGLRCVA